MTDYVVYHNADTMGYEALDVDVLSIVTNKTTAVRLGSRVWLIAGEGHPRSYRLRGTFLIDRIQPSDDNDAFQTEIGGTVGQLFDPMPALDDKPWWKDFLRSQGNFGFGFQPIDPRFAARLRAVLAAGESRGPEEAGGEQKAVSEAAHLQHGKESINARDGELVADFGPYKLVVRPHANAFRGVLWRVDGQGPATRLLTVTGPTLDNAYGQIESLFYDERLKQAAVSPGDDSATYAKAWSFLWPRLTPSQRKLLLAQYKAPGRRMSTVQMAEVLRWKGHSGINLWYGLAGLALFGEVPKPIEERNEDGSPVYSFAISTGERRNRRSAKSSEWYWTMRPEVAEGLRLAGCVTR